MADPWLVNEVMRELEDANATYFTLILQTRPSRYYLV